MPNGITGSLPFLRTSMPARESHDASLPEVGHMSMSGGHAVGGGTSVETRQGDGVSTRPSRADSTTTSMQSRFESGRANRHGVRLDANNLQAHFQQFAQETGGTEGAHGDIAPGEEEKIHYNNAEPYNNIDASGAEEIPYNNIDPGEDEKIHYNNAEPYNNIEASGAEEIPYNNIDPGEDEKIHYNNAEPYNNIDASGAEEIHYNNIGSGEDEKIHYNNVDPDTSNTGQGTVKADEPRRPRSNAFSHSGQASDMGMLSNGFIRG